MRQLDPMYEKFTPRERVALMVEALARKDYGEADRLIDTCERKRYEMADASYTEAFRLLHTLALHTRVMLLEKQAAGMACLGALTHYAGKSGRKDRKEFSRLVNRLQQSDSRMSGIWAAWDGFCGRLKVNPEKALAMGWGEVPESFKHGVAAEVFGGELGEVVETDQDAYAMASDFYEHAWKRIEDYGSWG